MEKVHMPRLGTSTRGRMRILTRRWKRFYVLWLTLALTLLFIVLSKLLLAHSPILDFGDAENSCEPTDDSGSDRRTHSTMTIRKSHSSVSCPDPYLLADSRTEGVSAMSWSTFRKALEAYKIFHREKLKQLKSESYLHRRGSGASEDVSAPLVKTLTWSCSQAKCSGMGDQLFRIQFWLLLAMMSDRIFIVHWDDALERSAKYLVPNEIDWSYFNQSLGMCSDEDSVLDIHSCSKIRFDSTSMWGFAWTKDEFDKFGNLLFSSEEHITVTGRVIAQGVMFVGKDSVLDPGEKIKQGFEKLGIADILHGREPQNPVRCGHKSPWYDTLHYLGLHHFMEIPEMNNGKVFATEPWLQVSHVLLCYLFKFPKILVKEVDKISQHMGIRNSRYLAVHLRTGFKGMPHEESFGTRWYFRNYKMFDEIYIWDGILEYGFELATRKLGSDSIVYLSTDTHVAKERYLEKYGNRLKVTNLTEIHPIYSRSKCEGRDKSRNSQTQSVYGDPHVTMWIDFFLLGRADIMVHGDSAFSENAGFLRPISHLNHVWLMHDNEKNCIASYLGSNSTCIVQYQ